MSGDKASRALQKRITEAALATSGRQDLYVAQAPAGTVLGEVHIELLQKPELDRLGDKQALGRLVDIAKIVDCIQSGSETYTGPQDAPEFLSDVFERVVANVRFLPAPLGAAERARFEQAQAVLYVDPPFIKTPAYNEFCVQRADLESQDVALLQKRQQLAGASPEKRAVLEIEIATLETLVRERREALEALDRAHGLSAAEAIDAAAGRSIDEIPQSVRMALDNIELSYVPDLATNETHVACGFLPSHLSEDNWIPLQLTGAEIAAQPGAGNGGAGPPDDFDADEIEVIEVEIQTLVCERPWLWRALFDNPRWDWQIPWEPISTGAAGAQTGTLIPAYVHAMIFGRNLVVKWRQQAGAAVTPTFPMTTATGFLTRALIPLHLKAQIAGPVRPAVTAPGPRPATLQPQASRVTAAPATASLRSVAPTTTLAARSIGSTAATRAATLRQPAMLRPRPDLEVEIEPDIETRPQPDWDRPRPFPLTRRSAGGQVIDQAGQPVALATVELQSGITTRKVTTGRDGSFMLAGLAEGVHQLRIERPGFLATGVTVEVPQSKAVTVQLVAAGPCEIGVELVERKAEGTVPFTGRAQIIIASGQTRRLEAVEGRSAAAFTVEPGSYTLSLVSPEAKQVTPAEAQVTVNPGAARPTARFEITRAAILSNPAVQLLGFVGCRVSASPRHDPALTG